MEKIEHRAVIKFLTKQGKNAQTILNEMETVYGEQCPSKSMIYKWHGLFKHGRESIEDDPRSGRPVEATTSDIVEKVEKIVLEDTRLKKKQLSALVGVSDTTILRILHDHLGDNTDYKEKGRTITGEYYATILEKLKDAIKEKRRGKLTKGVLLLQDNAPVHKSKVAMAALHTHGFESLVHPPYSPDLAPSDFYLFPNLKKDLRGRKFSDDNEVKEAILAHFEGKDKKYFYDGLEKLIHRSNKCIQLKGDYIEKEK
ncbi:unnamed protein product [Pieris macdunnoughi]|uniref:Tc1-like transposase DDE domain-containing protein n=1 Tax=Pieris macdunnoughi TaxID=345717 RepID=A0A821X023_9NEOP|nr:unnamed protein product [Pieris macdunnoughi]